MKAVQRNRCQYACLAIDGVGIAGPAVIVHDLHDAAVGVGHAGVVTADLGQAQRGCSVFKAGGLRVGGRRPIHRQRRWAKPQHHDAGQQ